MWEAFDKAGYYHLANLTAIVDVNRLGQRGPTELEWDLDAYARRVEAFGCRALTLDGHDLEAVDRALEQARGERERPTVLLARTVKGKGVPEIEDKEGWHGKALPADLAERAVAALGGPSDLVVRSQAPEPGEPAILPNPSAHVTQPTYEVGKKVATRTAYGEALAALAARPEVVALDGEVSNSTYSADFQKVAPDRFFEMFIAEQQMVAAAVGLAVRGYIPPRHSPPSSAAPTTSSAWTGSRRSASGWQDRTPGSRSEPTGPPRWPSRTLPRSGPSTDRWCSIRRMRTPPPNSSASWPIRLASSTCAPPAAPTRFSMTRVRRFAWAGRRCTGPARTTVSAS